MVGACKRGGGRGGLPPHLLCRLWPICLAVTACKGFPGGRVAKSGLAPLLGDVFRTGPVAAPWAKSCARILGLPPVRPRGQFGAVGGDFLAIEGLALSIAIRAAIIAHAVPFVIPFAAAGAAIKVAVDHGVMLQMVRKAATRQASPIASRMRWRGVMLPLSETELRHCGRRLRRLLSI